MTEEKINGVSVNDLWPLKKCKFCGSVVHIRIHEYQTCMSEPEVYADIGCPQCRHHFETPRISIWVNPRPKELLRAIDKIVDIWNKGNEEGR